MSGFFQVFVQLPIFRGVNLLAVIVPLALTGAALGVPSPAGAAATVATVPASIAADCSRDVDAQLGAWIASVPDGSTLEFTPQGCYRVDRTLAIQHRNGLTFEGNGANVPAFASGRELPPTRRGRAACSTSAGSNLTVRNVIVLGANPNAGIGDLAYVPALEGQSAYVIGGVQHMVLDHVQAYDVYGDFVFVGAATRDLLVENSTFARNGRQGWTINGQDIVFQNNSIRQTRRATVDLEPSAVTDMTRRVTIRNNTIGVGRLYFLANEGRAAPTEDISILNNTFVNKAITIKVNPPSGTRRDPRDRQHERHRGRLRGRRRVRVQRRAGRRGAQQRAADAAGTRDLGRLGKELPRRRRDREPVPLRQGAGDLQRRELQRLAVEQLRRQPVARLPGHELRGTRLTLGVGRGAQPARGSRPWPRST